MNKALTSGRQGVTTIDGDCLAVEKLVGGDEQDGARHVSVVTGSGSRRLALVLLLGYVRLLVGCALAGSHLGWENSRGDIVDSDLQTIVLNLFLVSTHNGVSDDTTYLICKHASEMDGSCLAGVVLRMVLACLDLARYGGDVDYRSRPTV